jgi:hypothetical protein
VSHVQGGDKGLAAAREFPGQTSRRVDHECERPAGQALGLGAPALFGIIQRLTARLAQLEPRLEAGEEAAWSAYVETVGALALLLPQLAPERRGALLTTSEMAERLGVAPKTLLRHKARGLVRPTLQHGKFIRWRGTEAGA